MARLVKKGGKYQKCERCGGDVRDDTKSPTQTYCAACFSRFPIWPTNDDPVEAAVRADAESASSEELEAASDILHRATVVTCSCGCGATTEAGKCECGRPLGHD